MPGSTIAVPTNFGNWSGPGYAGGRIFRSLDNAAAGKPGVLDEDGNRSGEQTTTSRNRRHTTNPQAERPARMGHGREERQGELL